MAKYKTASAAIGKKIRTLRKQFRLSQERLGEIADVTYQQIQKYENGTDRITIDRLKLISNGLKVPLTYFFKEDKPKVNEKQVQYYALGELSKEEVDLIKLFRRVKGKKAKEKLIGLIKSAKKFVAQG